MTFGANDFYCFCFAWTSSREYIEYIYIYTYFCNTSIVYISTLRIFFLWAFQTSVSQTGCATKFWQKSHQTPLKISSKIVGFLFVSANLSVGPSLAPRAWSLITMEYIMGPNANPLRNMACNKALIKGNQWLIVPYIRRPYFLQGWHWWGPLRFPWVYNNCLSSKSCRSISRLIKCDPKSSGLFSHPEWLLYSAESC